MEHDPSFGRWLRRRRRALDLTQAALAHRVGCTTAHLRNIETDRRRPSRELAARLATVLAVDATDRVTFVQFARGASAVHARQLDKPLPERSGAGPAVEQPAPSALAGTLPVAATSLVGRASEIALVCDLLTRADKRLITLTGPGGTGKTRLALEVARVAAWAFRDGVAFVALSAIADPLLIAGAIGQALGLTEHDGQPIEAVLVHYLRDKHVLLLLDNFEQVLDGAGVVADLLASAPQLNVLVTSRAPLRLTGEQQCPILPLALPDRRQLADTALVSTYPAIALFEQRVQAVQPAFRVADDNARTVAAICARLDGLPLAIELVAPRIKVLGVDALLIRLQDSLGLLNGGARDLPARQQTMRATLDWSFALLAPHEQVLFRRLGVFAGGCTLEAIEAVCAHDGDLENRLLETLQALVDSSLLQQAPATGGAPRFSMLEVIRTYAREHLVASGEADALCRQHAAYCLTLAEAAEDDLRGGPRQAELLLSLELEHANIRAALSWAIADDGDTAVRLCGALWRFWNLREYLSEGRRWLEAALTAGTNVSPAARAKALHGVAELASAQGEHAAAQARYEESLALFRALDDQQRIATLLHNLAIVAQAQGEYATARTRLEESLALFRALDDRWGIAFAVNDLGNLAYERADYTTTQTRLEESLALFRALDGTLGTAWALRGLGLLAYTQGAYATARAQLEESLALFRALDNNRGSAWALRDLGLVANAQAQYITARVWLEESLALFRALGSKRGIAWALRDLGVVVHMQGEHATARAWLEESLALFRALGSKRGIAYAAYDSATMDYDHGEYATARVQLEESLVLFRALDDRWGASMALDGLAAVASAQADTQRALRLAGVATRLREELGAANDHAARARLAEALERARRAVDAAEAEAAWLAGRALSLEQAAQEVLDTPSVEAGAADPAQNGAALANGGLRARPARHLTAREMDVLRVVAEGATDQEVAQRLGLKLRTVTSYLTSIYAKLNARTRTAAVRVAREQHVI